MIFISLITKDINKQIKIINTSLIQKACIINTFIYKKIKVNKKIFEQIIQNQQLKLNIEDKMKIHIKQLKDLFFIENGKKFQLIKENMKNIEIYTKNKKLISTKIQDLKDKTEYHIYFNYYRNVSRDNVIKYKHITDNIIELSNFKVQEVAYVK